MFSVVVTSTGSQDANARLDFSACLMDEDTASR